MIVHHALTVGQRGLYRHHQLYPNDTSYNLTYLTRIEGSVDAPRLCAVMESVLNDNEAFKSDFVDINGRIIQRMTAERVPTVRYIERDAGRSEEEFENEVHAVALKLQARRIDLATWPLHDFRVYRSSERRAYILISLPHVLADGYSYVIWLDEVSARYNGRAQQLVTHCVEESDDGKTQSRQEAIERRTEEFYKRELDGVASLEMPTISQPRDGSGAIRGRVLRFKVDRADVERALARAKLTANCFFLAVYASMLRRLFDTDRVAIGYAVPNRTAADRRTIGCFINAVPVVLDIQMRTSIGEVSKEVTRKLFSVHRYQAFDVDKVELDSTRTNCNFTFYSDTFDYNIEGCVSTPFAVEREHLVSEMRLMIGTRREAYDISFDLGTFFDHVDVEAAFRSTLEAAVRDPSIRVSDLELATSFAGELSKDEPVRTSGGLARAFEAVVKSQAHRVALRFLDETVTYGELNTLANRIARQIARYAPEGSHVALSAEHSITAVAVILAILKLGRCYVPMDPRAPAERANHVLADLDHPLLLSDTSIRADSLLLQELLSACAEQDESDLALEFDAQTPAYVIYTSGSTGVPKGVTISYANLSSLIESCDKSFAFRSDDVWTLFHSFSFDFSIWEVFASLLHGAALVVVDSNTTQDPARFYELLCRENVTVMNHTPSLFRGLIREDSERRGTLRPRYVFLGGEALQFPMLEEWVVRHPLHESKLVNLYGPSEATVLVTYHELSEGDLNTRSSIIGRPIDRTRIEIRTAEAQAAVAGIPGEIIVAGGGVARGYLKRPDATGEKFLFEPEGVRFRTGDLARLRADGTLEYLGRLDRQVKVRGFRVELAEIELALRKTGLVIDCAVDCVATDPSSDARLVAYLVPRDSTLPEQQLRESLRQMLPAYMIPGIFVPIDRVPTTIGGKLDLAALAAQAVKSSSGELKGSTATERWLYELVAQKVRRNGFEVTDNLFDVGLASLDIAELVGKVRADKRFESLSVMAVFEHSTIRALAHHLDSGMGSASATDATQDRARQRLALPSRRRVSTSSEVL